MNTNQINGDALRRTVTLMFGAEAVDLIAKVYVAINDAQVDAFSMGRQLGREDAFAYAREVENEMVEQRLDAAFDNGFTLGHATAEEEAEDALEALAFTANQSFDNGYLDGVKDARANPALADETVQDIINEQAAEHFDELDECEDVWSDGAIYAAVSDADWYEAHFN